MDNPLTHNDPTGHASYGAGGGDGCDLACALREIADIDSRRNITPLDWINHTAVFVAVAGLRVRTTTTSVTMGMVRCRVQEVEDAV